MRHTAAEIGQNQKKAPAEAEAFSNHPQATGLATGF
jgi:hypothetical protein